MVETNLFSQPASPSDNNFRPEFSQTPITPHRETYDRIVKSLVEEGGDDVVKYLKSEGILSEPNILVLSAKHHYYYDLNELRCTSVLVIMNRLNRIKHIDSFLQVLNLVLRPDSKFIGCFHDISSGDGTGLYSRMYKGFINFLDLRYERQYNRSTVINLFESHGFRIENMTLINGLTYFRALSTRVLKN